MFKKLTPNFMTKDVNETVRFYQDKLGFKMEMAVAESEDNVLTELPKDKKLIYASIKKDQVDVSFQIQESFSNDVPAMASLDIGASVSFYCEVENVKEYYDKIKDNVDVVKDLATAWYGMDEFYIRDNNGYILAFAQQKEG